MSKPASLRLPAHGVAAGLIAGAVFLAGCAETSAIRSTPRGAAVYVNREFIGITPTQFAVPRSQKQPFEYRIEKINYQTASGALSTVVRPGRIVGYFFSFGLLSAFKGPIGFRPVDVELRKLEEPVEGATTASDAELPRVITEQLDRLDRLKKNKRVDDEQYHQIRDRILGG